MTREEAIELVGLWRSGYVGEMGKGGEEEMDQAGETIDAVVAALSGPQTERIVAFANALAVAVRVYLRRLDLQKPSWGEAAAMRSFLLSYENEAAGLWMKAETTPGSQPKP